MDAILCSDCFRNEGLRLNAWKLGSVNNIRCPSCDSENGRALDKDRAMTLVHDFFTKGTVHREAYGAAPLLVFNEHTAGFVEDQTPQDLRADVELLTKKLGIGIFYYGQRAWMLGENYPLKSLLDDAERESIIKRIVTEYPSVNLEQTVRLYRVRLNPETATASQFDAPPAELLGQGRLDAPNFPVLYVSQDLEGCVHECRASMEDEIFMATLQPSRALKLLNLAAVYFEENATEFDSLDMAVHMLFSARSHSYHISRAIAQYAAAHGYDGVQYPSYFTHIRTGETPFGTVAYGISVRMFKKMKEVIEANTAKNIGIFGRPLEEGTLVVQSINKVILRQVSYDLSFGPTGY